MSQDELQLILLAVTAAGALIAAFAGIWSAARANKAVKYAAEGVAAATRSTETALTALGEERAERAKLAWADVVALQWDRSRNELILENYGPAVARTVEVQVQVGGCSGATIVPSFGLGKARIPQIAFSWLDRTGAKVASPVWSVIDPASAKLTWYDGRGQQETDWQDMPTH